ncbi:spindle pole body component 110-like [Papaver somniferum]|uniref:spindle pole body component 110-like n=1 Tax=Papaver somniferum TaxID=3469 RepID=UPI000E6FF1B8|nr:spindle pole body component 110-like [Papaver somniferum]
MSHEQLEKSSARIRELEKQLAEEKKYSSKQESKSDELRTRCMKRQMAASEAKDLLEDARLENLNLTTQIDSYVSENGILTKKIETLFLQVDRLTVESLNNEELNFHLHKENEGLRIELQRVGNFLTTSRNLHSSSLATVKRLEEDKVRIIKRKDKSVADLRKYRDEVNDLKLDNDRQRNEERFKNQVLNLSRQRDELTREVSDLKEDIKYLNEDFANMEKDDAKVAKITRKNAQVAKAPSDEDDDAEDTEIDDDIETEDPKGEAPLITKVAAIPSSSTNLPDQSRDIGNVEVETVDAVSGAEVKTDGVGGDVEEKIVQDVHIQQLPLQS